MPSALSIGAALTLLAAPGLGGPTPRVPLCPGLTIVTAVSQREGDYESIKVVESTDDREVAFRYSSERSDGGTIQQIRARRVVLLEDQRQSELYLRHFSGKAALRIPGTTAIGTSSAVLRALKASGQARLGIFAPVASASPADPKAHPNIYDYKEIETIRRVGTGSVLVPVVVNDVPVNLPAIEARGDYTGNTADFFFLDDEANPMALRYRIGTDVLDVVKIAYPCSETWKPKTPPPPSRLERSLAETGRADVYSIYFSFNSDEIREESDSTIKEIGDVLRRHPIWKLAIGGHTDNIGSDAYNLELSERRAKAVKAAVVGRHGIGAARLSSAGYGKKSPKDTNDTLEGRARNRRVELVRTS